MGRMVRWTKRGGWVVGLTPFQHRVAGLLLFQKLRFKGVVFSRTHHCFKKCHAKS